MNDQFTSVQWDRDEQSDSKLHTEMPIPEDEDSDTNSHTGSAVLPDEASNDDDTALNPHKAEVGLVTDGSANGTQSATTEPDSIFIDTVVSTPVTEYDGQNYFISYLVETKSNNPAFKSKSFSTRRRFSDFNFLYVCLTSDLPTCIIPPLPNKERLEYLKGGRFAEHFTAKRSSSLNTFLSRISKHPVLKNAKIFHIFLEDSDYWNTYKQNLKISKDMNSSAAGSAGNPADDKLEAFSDYIMNAFKKPTYESKNAKEFQEILLKSNKLQDNLNKVEKIYQRVTKKQGDLAHDFDKFGNEIMKLNKLLASDFKTDLPNGAGNSDTRLSEQFSAFHENVRKVSEYTTVLNENIDYHYLTSLKDLDHYISQLKHLIKLKEAKSLDFEMLSSYLDKAVAERQTLMHGGGVTSSAEGAIGFLSKKLESITSGFTHSYPVAQGNATNERVAKLTSRIELLEKEKAAAFKMFQTFEIDILNEYSLFDTIKNEEIFSGLQDLSTHYLEYYTSIVKAWQPLDFGPVTGEFDSAIPSKLKDDDPLFEHSDISNNNAAIEDSLIKIQEQKQRDPLPHPPQEMDTQIDIHEAANQNEVPEIEHSEVEDNVHHVRDGPSSDEIYKNEVEEEEHLHSVSHSESYNEETSEEEDGLLGVDF
ncbi:unnamed protein product [Kuraishia capsulata CBS 1993]|uniref:Sorting nexin-4 n=1 Tax=Kuraishia capsulata CBS 1993 TaxID=1382522 RepID=W6MSG7_9ASCO|nr:uncharacterized protein KUCA_T00005316001 [Kuraishia capsulata CBS 1993]CDK29328.1 unnamed protein product [Kuraishia capsulata CBS 1993]